MLATLGLGSAAIKLVFNDHVANGALPLFSAVSIGDLFHTADIQGFGDTVVAGVSVSASVTRPVRAVLKGNAVISLGDGFYLVKAGVGQGTAIAAEVIAVIVIGVAGASGIGHRMRTGIACAIGIVTYPGFVGDIADVVVAHIAIGGVIPPTGRTGGIGQGFHQTVHVVITEPFFEVAAVALLMTAGDVADLIPDKGEVLEGTGT